MEKGGPIFGGSTVYGSTQALRSAARLGGTGCLAQEEEHWEEVLIKSSQAACDERESLFCLAPVPISCSCRAELW